MIVNSKFTSEQKIRIIARELCQLDLDQVFIIPAIREIIDEAREELDSIEDKSGSDNATD